MGDLVIKVKLLPGSRHFGHFLLFIPALIKLDIPIKSYYSEQ